MELYYNHPFITQSDAVVVECKALDNGYGIVLDNNILFPTGGGQLCDIGMINDTEIISVSSNDGKIYHLCNRAFQLGETVHVSLDLASRIDHTAQHTGEHIISGLAAKLFGANNVGFHMAKDYCTLDLDKFLNEDELFILLKEVNRAVTSDYPITFSSVSAAEAKNLHLRKFSDKLADSQEDIRIVFIDDGRVDSCACCGTHFSSTASVGTVLFTSAERYKSGIRIFFACNERAIRFQYENQKLLSSVAKDFSTSSEDVPIAIKKLKNDMSNLHMELKSKTSMLCDLLSDSLLSCSSIKNSINIIVKLIPNFNANDLKLLSTRIIEKSETSVVTLLFCASNVGTEYRMACSESVKLSMRNLCSSVNAMLNGKGGGSDSFAQGKSPRQISREDLEMLESYLISVL